MIPLVHDFEDERVLVIGGGAVGARKARTFAREADVLVVSPDFVADSFGGAQRIRAAPTPADVSDLLADIDPALVVAATDDERVNDAIEAAAEERNLLVNRTDEAGSRNPGSVIVPATVRDDPVVVAVSTSGESPALSRYLRRRLETEFAHAGAMASLTSDLRAALTAAGHSETERTEALRAVVESERVWKALDTEGANPREHAAAVIAESTDATVAGDQS